MGSETSHWGNHFLLPQSSCHDDLSPRYGNIAIDLLIQSILKLGCRKENMVAKIYGGAQVLQVISQEFSVGDRNIQCAMSILKKEKIKIIEKDVGGDLGRKIKFNSHTGAVTKKILQTNAFINGYRI